VGPQPKRRPIISLPIKAAVVKAPPIGAPNGMPERSPKAPDRKPVNGVRKPVGAGGVVEVASTIQPAPAATGSVPVAPWAARRLAREQVLDWLTAAYPKAPFGPDAKPLALGVGRTLWPQAKAAGIGRKAFNDAMGWLTRTPAYLEALVEDGAMRIGLDGAQVEPVSLEDQANALNRLAKIERRLTSGGADP
jgi:ProQ/FINO family